MVDLEVVSHSWELRGDGQAKVSTLSISEDATLGFGAKAISQEQGCELERGPGGVSVQAMIRSQDRAAGEVEGSTHRCQARRRRKNAELSRSQHEQRW